MKISSVNLIRLVLFLFLIIGSIFTVHSRGQYCLDIFSSAGADILAGLNPYLESKNRPDFYKYSMFWAYLFAPFDWIPRIASQYLFYWLNVGSLFISLIFLSRLTPFSRERRYTLVAFVVLLGHGGILANGFYGQVNSLLLALIFGFYFCWKTNRKTLASFLIALATALKLFPILFLFFPLVKKDWWTISLSLVFASLMLVLPGFHLGWESYFEFHSSWMKILAHDSTHPPMKMAFWPVLMQYFGETPVMVNGQPDLVSIAFPSVLLKTIYYGMLGLHVGLIVYATAIKRNEWVGLGLSFVGVLMFSHMTESPTFALTTGAYFALALTAMVERSLVLWLGIAATLVVGSLLSSDLIGGVGREFVLQYSIKTWNLVLMTALLAACLFVSKLPTWGGGHKVPKELT